MKNNNILFGLSTFFIVLLLINFASASIGNLGTFKVDSCINLMQACSDCTYNNVSSVRRPDGSQALGEVVMVKSGTEYTYNFCNTTVSGTYHVNGFGDAGGLLTNWNYLLDVTPTGIVQASILNNPILLILLGISLMFLVLALIIKSYPMGFIAGIMFTITGIYTMIFGFNNYTDDYSRTVGMVVIALGFIFMLASGYEWISDAGDDSAAVGTAEVKDDYD